MGSWLRVVEKPTPPHSPCCNAPIVPARGRELQVQVFPAPRPDDVSALKMKLQDSIALNNARLELGSSAGDTPEAVQKRKQEVAINGAVKVKELFQLRSAGLLATKLRLPQFVLHTIPYVVRVVCPGGTGTGTVMQYRCGEPPLFVSEDWWLLTNMHVLCVTDTTVVEAKGHVEFFYECGAAPVRVDLDLSTCRVRSPPPVHPDSVPEVPTVPPAPQAPTALPAWDLAIVRCGRV